MQNLFNGTGTENRVNGGNFLIAGGTVHNDNAVDTIQGSGDRDWLFYDLSIDRVRGNIRDDVFANELDALFGS